MQESKLLAVCQTHGRVKYLRMTVYFFSARTMQEHAKAVESYQGALENLENNVNEMTEQDRMELYRVLSNKGQT